MKHYSYFLVKPDGIRHMDSIMEEVENGNFSSIYPFAVHDFSDIIKKLYHRHYDEKGDKFRKSFGSYLYGVNQIYNNYGILLVVGDDGGDYEDLVQRVYDTKMKIREENVNDNIGIATNIPGEAENDIRIISSSGKTKKLRCLRRPGYHRINDLNFIHCPDPRVDVTLEELDILYENGILSDENLIREDMMSAIVKYRCDNFIEDMRRKEYVSLTGPNLSGFIRSRVEADKKSGDEKKGELRKTEEGTERD